MQFCRNDSRQLVYSMVDNTGANRPMFSQLDQHGAFTPCCTRSASPFPSVSRVAGARPRSFDDLSLFLFRKPFFPRLPPPHAFAKVFLDVRTACEPSAKSKPFSLIARWKFHFGSLSASRVSRNCDPLNRAPLYGVPEHTGSFFYYHLSSFVSLTKKKSLRSFFELEPDIALEECIYIISCSFLGDRSAGLRLQLPSWVLESAFVDLLSSLGQELSKIHGFSPGQLIPPDLLETTNYTRKLGLATPLTGFQLADYRLCSPDYLTTRLRSGIKQLFFNRKWI